MDDSTFTLAHPAPLEDAGSAAIPIQTAVRELPPPTLREKLRFWIILIVLILLEVTGVGLRYMFHEPEELPEDPVQVTLVPPEQLPPPPPPPPPPPAPKVKQKEPLPPLEQQLQSMQPRFEPLPEPPALKQKESPSKLAVAKDKKPEDKPTARVGVSAPGLGAGFFDKWFYDAAKAVEAAYRAPPSEASLPHTNVILEFTYANGVRSSIEVLKSSGDPAVDAACVAAIREARLPPTPTSFINRPIPIRVTMPVPHAF